MVLLVDLRRVVRRPHLRIRRLLRDGVGIKERRFLDAVALADKTGRDDVLARLLRQLEVFAGT